jgi:hypothetical protein
MFGEEVQVFVKESSAGKCIMGGEGRVGDVWKIMVDWLSAPSFSMGKSLFYIKASWFEIPNIM